jgi:hypothetical protein
MSTGLVPNGGLVALWRVRALIDSGLVGQVPAAQLALARVDYVAGQPAGTARVGVVVAATTDGTQVRVARSKYTPSSAALTVSQGPDENIQDVVLAVLARHNDSTSAVVSFTYPTSPASDFALEVTTHDPAARQGSLKVSGGGQTVTIDIGAESTLEQVRAGLEPIASARPQPPEEFLDESLLRPHLESVLHRLGELPPGAEGFNWKCLAIELAAEVLCGLVCGVIAGVLCHEGTAG